MRQWGIGETRALERESRDISVQPNGPHTAMVALGASNSSRKLASHASSAVEFQQKRPSVSLF